MDTATARTRLEQMLRDLDESAKTLEAEGAGDIGELNTVDQHPADLGSEVFDAQRQSAVLDVARDQRAQVVAALQRIDDGSYGRCLACGEPIADERLDVRPEAAYCMADQQRLERLS